MSDGLHDKRAVLCSVEFGCRGEETYGEKKNLFSSAGGTNYRIVLNSAIRPALKYAKCSVTAVVLLVQ